MWALAPCANRRLYAVGSLRVIASWRITSKPAVPLPDYAVHDVRRLAPRCFRLRVNVTVCDGWGAGVFTLLFGFHFLFLCRGGGGVRISRLCPCADRQGCRAAFGFILLFLLQRKKGGVNDLGKLRNGAKRNVAILTFLNLQRKGSNCPPLPAPGGREIVRLAFGVRKLGGAGSGGL